MYGLLIPTTAEYVAYGMRIVPPPSLGSNEGVGSVPTAMSTPARPLSGSFASVSVTTTRPKLIAEVTPATGGGVTSAFIVPLCESAPTTPRPLTARNSTVCSPPIAGMIGRRMPRPAVACVAGQSTAAPAGKSRTTEPLGPRTRIW